MSSSSERGIALITVLLVMMLMSALLVGFTSVVVSDRRYRFLDQDRNQAFYGASAGIEKLTADLGNLFSTNIAPTAAQITAFTASGSAPAIPSVAFASSIAPGILPTSSLSATNCASPNSIRTIGTNGYTIMFCAGPGGDPSPVLPPKPIKSGPYEGLVALQTPYQLDATARTPTGGDVHLVRAMEAVAIPVFQFGMFSTVDLSFFAGPDFSFGGRVHTNGNLFLAEGDGGTLTLTDRVTAYGEVIRQEMQNGVSIDSGSAHRGTVNVAYAPGSFRALARNEGSLAAGLGSAPNLAPPWETTSRGNYNLWLRNHATGVTPLNLSLLSAGGSKPDLLRRPETTDENLTSPVLFNERLFTKASLRILLSDTPAKITALPGVTAAIAPVQLDGDWVTTRPTNVTGTYGPIDLQHPPIARTTTPITMAVLGGSSTSQYHVNDVRAFLPVMTLAGAPVVCEEKTLTSFTHCTVTVAAPNPSQFMVPGGTAVSTLGAAAGNNQTIDLVAGGNTNAFNPFPFWSGNDKVTCSGWQWGPRAFTGCIGAQTDPTNGTELRLQPDLSPPPIGLIGGYLKIERQNANGTWADVTLEILNYGISGPNLDGAICGDPAPNAIVRLQRFRDNPGPAYGGCFYNTADAAGAGNATQYWPNVLFDTREAVARDTAPGGTTLLPLGGVMHYITIDVANLSRWFAGTLPGTGASARTENGGFTVYFSDRRNNRNAAGLETGEYGWEDFVNPASPSGAANNVLDTGEDLNASGTLETYGNLPNYTDPTTGVVSLVALNSTPPLNGTATPSTLVNRLQAQVNRAILFRHALKLVNGQDIRGLGITGLTVVSENPVYIQGNWNANGNFTAAHAATAVIADAVTLLTTSWNDTVSFTHPYDPGGTPAGRPRGAETWYRLGIIAGKGIAFPNPAGTASDFGTDGGAHNFLRYLQTGGQAVNYRGSIATFYYNRQAVGTFKCCTTVYDAPLRRYAFDTDFLNPALLPPNTPLFRDLNAVGFAQELRPGR